MDTRGIEGKICNRWTEPGGREDEMDDEGLDWAKYGKADENEMTRD